MATKCKIFLLDGLDENGDPIVKISFNKFKADQKEKFDWQVLNKTSAPHTVMLNNFAPSNPFTQSPPFATGSIVGGRSTKINVDVTATATPGRYTYNIYVDGVLGIDPELEIEMPTVPGGRKPKKASSRKK